MRELKIANVTSILINTIIEKYDNKTSLINQQENHIFSEDSEVDISQMSDCDLNDKKNKNNKYNKKGGNQKFELQIDY